VQSARSVIELKNIGKTFGSIKALAELNLSVVSGEIYGLLGPNGAGKSTTVNIICGLLAPTTGSVTVAGFNVGTHPLDAKRSIGAVPQELALYSELTVRQNLAFFGRLYGLHGSELQTRIDRLLRMVRLEGRDRSVVGTLSGGMQRRLNIAAALLHTPAVVLMDEATVGLDPQNRANILEIVQSIAADGAAVLYSTHYMDEVEQICGRIGIIDHGKLLVEGTLAELRQQAGGKEVVTLRGSFDPAKAAAAFTLRPGEAIIKSSIEEIVLNLQGAEGRLTQLLSEAAHAGDVREVSMNRQSLESLFIQLTGRDLRA
jgi:ABC-2 type transport system ATP-binding protein